MIKSCATYFGGVTDIQPSLPPNSPQVTAPQGTEALLCFNLYAASHAFIRLYTPHLERLDLTYPQFLVLLSLRDQDRQGVGTLGATLAMETNTLSPLLKRMTAAGLVTRVRSQQDERRVVVALTETGRVRAAQAAEVPGCIARDSGMTEESYHQTLKTLQLLRAQIDTAAQQARRGA